MSNRPAESKTPTFHRTFPRLLFLLLLLSPHLASAQTRAPEGGLRESDVIRLAKERAPGSLVASATEKLADSNVRAAGLPPNPSFVWARESVNTGPVNNRGSQDLLGLNVPIDVTRTNTARSLAAAEGAWLRAEASLNRTDAVLQAVLAYYDVALAAERIEVLTTAVEDLVEAGRVLERRESAGSVSGYESARLDIESELGRSHLAEAQATWENEKMRLAALLGQPENSLRIDADLTLLSEEREKALARADGSSRSSMKLAESSKVRASEAKKRADFSWFPTVEIGGGLKRGSSAGNADGLGYFVGANVGLPIFDRGQGQKARAEAQRAVVAARTEAMSRQIAADIQSAHLVFRQARDELKRFEEATTESVQRLLRAAQSGYNEGERSIVELLDAQRARTDVALRRLHLLASAKRAEVRLRSAAGELK